MSNNNDCLVLNVQRFILNKNNAIFQRHLVLDLLLALVYSEEVR